jgi:chorismate dehydratase
LGQVDYLNCLPVYHALEEGLLEFDGKLVKGPPTMLNRMFLEGSLDATPISSIEYARNNENCLILPDISISANGRVASILLFSKYPVTELEGKTIAVTTSSATSVVLLRILLEHYYHVEAELVPHSPNLKDMLAGADGALLIGDDAMLAHSLVGAGGAGLVITDLGEAWKQFTGHMMVYAVWVVKKDFAREYPAGVDYLSRLLVASKQLGKEQRKAIIKKAHAKTGLPYEVLEDYFKTIRHGFNRNYRKALSLFYDYAYKSGIIEERAKLKIWGDRND